MAVVNRRLPVPVFSVKHQGNHTLKISTPDLELEYHPGQPFTSTALTVRSTPSRTEVRVRFVARRCRRERCGRHVDPPRPRREPRAEAKRDEMDLFDV